jgi:hypothetical protein
MQAVKEHKTPSQLKGERYLRSKKLLVPTSVLRNTDKVKLKARALRLTEEYQRKYLTKRKPAGTRHASQSTSVAPALALALWFSFLAAIVISVLLGYLLKYILSKNDERRHYY